MHTVAYKESKFQEKNLSFLHSYFAKLISAFTKMKKKKQKKKQQTSICHQVCYNGHHFIEPYMKKRKNFY